MNWYNLTKKIIFVIFSDILDMRTLKQVNFINI